MRTIRGNKKVLILCTWYLILSSFSSAQTQNNDYYLSAGAHYGFILAHHGSMQYLVDGHVAAFEFDYIKPTHGEKKWERVYHYPEIGICFFYIGLSNPAQLGDGISI